MQEMQIQSLGRENPLEQKMATPSRYSCLENSMDSGARQATVHGVTKQLDMTEHSHTQNSMPSRSAFRE